MSPEILSILILVVIFIIATTLPINMGVPIRGCRSGRRLRCRSNRRRHLRRFPWRPLHRARRGHLPVRHRPVNGTVDGWCTLPSAASEDI